MIVEHWEGRRFTQNYSQFMKEYQEHEERLLLEDGEDTTAIDTTSIHATSSVGLTSSSNNGNSQPASSFSFGTAAPAPSPAAKPFSFAPKPASKPTFSFGAPSSSSNGGSNAPSATSSSFGDNNNDDPTSNPDDGKVEKVEQENNADEEILYEVRAKHLKCANDGWKKYGAGVLRLYRHKVTSKQRMVKRNEIGKVQFNVGVSKGMKFEKVLKKTKKGEAAYVKFLAVEDASKGPENFMLQVKPEALDKFHEVLESMVA